MALPTLATFVHYGNGTREEAGIVRVSTQVTGHAGAWRYTFVLGLDRDIFGAPVLVAGLPIYGPSGRTYREESRGTFNTKREAIASLRTLILDYCGHVPAETAYRLNRSGELPFPGTAPATEAA